MISGKRYNAPQNGQIVVLLSGLEFGVNNSMLCRVQHSLRLIMLSL